VDSKKNEKTRGEQQRMLRMEFKTFVNHLTRLPAIVVKSGSRTMGRFVGWTNLHPVLFRTREAIRHQRR
jgi:hypothetical protein